MPPHGSHPREGAAGGDAPQHWRGRARAFSLAREVHRRIGSMNPLSFISCRSARTPRIPAPLAAPRGGQAVFQQKQRPARRSAVCLSAGGSAGNFAACRPMARKLKPGIVSACSRPGLQPWALPATGSIAARGVATPPGRPQQQKQGYRTSTRRATYYIGRVLQRTSLIRGDRCLTFRRCSVKMQNRKVGD